MQHSGGESAWRAAEGWVSCTQARVGPCPSLPITGPTVLGPLSVPLFLHTGSMCAQSAPLCGWAGTWGCARTRTPHPPRPQSLILELVGFSWAPGKGDHQDDTAQSGGPGKATQWG